MNLKNQYPIFSGAKGLISINCETATTRYSYGQLSFKNVFIAHSLILFLFILPLNVFSQLTVLPDPLCSNNCCTQGQCNCTAGVIVTGGTGGPYNYVAFGSSGLIGNTACISNLCPGIYTFNVTDGSGNFGSAQLTVGNNCCTLVCPPDTAICFGVPDSMVHLSPAHYTNPNSSGGTAGGPADHCFYDSIWNNSPNIYPVGVTVVTWYVHLPNGQIDSCTQNVTRNPPSPFAIIFNTVPPVIGGVINICNGQSITFTNNSIGSTGQLWNFGNGYYSGNVTHTEPASHYPPGTYYDTLTVYDDCGNPHDTAFMVVVDSSSGPDIFCISVVCPGDTVTYHTNANCATYNWSVTGGVFFPIPASTSDSATVVWGPGPTGTISLSVANCTPPSTCAIATVKTVNIVPATLPVSGDTMICAGTTTTYCIDCIPGNTHSWEILPAGAGTITGQGTCCLTVQWNPTFIGTVTIQVNYHNVLTGSGCNLPGACEHDPGCGGTGTITVQVRPIFGISGPSKVCPNMTSAPFNGMNTTLNTIEPGTTWKVVTPAPSTLTFGTTALFNAYTWNAGPGNYFVTAYPPPNIYCNDSAIVKVEVVDIKIPNAISGPDTVCPNVPYYYSVIPNMTGVTYTWLVTGGTVLPPINGSTVQIQWNPGGGSVSVIQTLTASPGCVSASSPLKTVVTWPNFPLPVITPSTSVACLKGTIIYSIPNTLISNGTYTWSIVPSTAGNILSANGTNQITIQWVSNAITPIFVKLKISRCYTDSVMFPITLFNLPPVPNISYTPLNPCVFDPVSFSTTSSPSWNWDFGDGGTSNSQFPVHPYSTSGDFTVQLYVTNAQGCSDTAYTKIHVDTIPVIPVITGASNVCRNATQTYTFSQPLSPGASYTWSLSAPVLGQIITNSSTTLTVKWTTPGTDTVKLRIQATCIDTTLKFVVQVNPLPTAGISVPTPVCEGTALTFNGSGGVSYSWSFPGGSPSSSLIQSPVVNYAVKGNYTVSLVVTDANGCVGTATTNITVNPRPLAIITGPAQICAFPAMVTIAAVDAGGYTFAWSPSGSGPTITPSITSATTFSVVVTNAFGCTRTSNSITIDTTFCPPPDTGDCRTLDTINFVNTPPVCLTDSFYKTGNATLTGWNFGDGNSAGNTSPVVNTYPYPGIFLVEVQGFAPGFTSLGIPCTTNVRKAKFVTIPFDARYEFSFQCNGAGVMQTVVTNTSLYLNNPSNYQWTWKDSTTNTVLSTAAFPLPFTLSAGTHQVYLAIFDNATQARCTTMHTINVPVPITAAFSISAPVCQNAYAYFTDNSVNIANEVSRVIDNGNGSQTIFSPDSLIYTSAPGPFTASITVTDIYGCVSTATQSVSVTPAGTGTLTVGPNSCDSVQLTASGTGPFIWQVINPPPSPPNPVYVKTSGFYKVTAIAPNGCPYTAGPVQVIVKKSPDATITGKTTYCQGENLDLKTTSAGTSVIWNRLAPTFLANVGNTPNLNIIAAVPGNFIYQVIVTGLNGCTASATYAVTVDAVPSSAVIDSSGPLTFCAGDSVILTVNPPGATYTWSKSPTPPISSPYDTNDSLTVTVSGTYSVIVQTANGCPYPAINPVVVTVNPVPVANITGDTVVCENETLTLQTTPVNGGSYSWSGPFASGTGNPFVKNSMQLYDSGMYDVVVTNPFGCVAKDSIWVVVNPSPITPIVTSIPAGPLCEGLLYTFIASPPFTPPVVYTWNTGQIGNSINAALAGIYFVVATNQFGCSATSNADTIHPLPDLSCVPSGCYDFCDECDSVIIPGPFGLTSYTWQKLVGNTFVFYANTQNVTVLSPGGIFRLLGANQWGCADSSDTLKIDFHICCPGGDTVLCIDTCTNFNDNFLYGFQPHPTAPNVLINLSNVGSQGGAGDYYISVQDQTGPSQLLAGDQFNGPWCCGELCFDYKLIDDMGSGANVNPTFIIRNGTLAFSFTASVTANVANGWHHICAPITDCNPPPVSPAGTWAPVGATTNNDWTTVLNNVTELVFRVDYIASVPAEISGYDNICLTPNVPQISAGNDTTICQGDVITLHVEGCNSTPHWYQLVAGGVIFLNDGQIIDVSPQQNTCYIVTCCNAGACCCDSDTICINVNPKPIIIWPAMAEVCQSSDSIYLDPANIFVFINNTNVPLTNTNGTWTFVGPGVIGNYFHPTTVGMFTIQILYTDSNGCTGTAFITIKVVQCCTNICNVNAGPDQVICQGNPAILSAQGCDSLATWYQLTPEGPIQVGIGINIDIFPQQSACYMVICCGMAPCCCDTDTVCITVYPHPTVVWPVQYAPVCNNSDSIYLDPMNIFVFFNNTYTPLPLTGGTWSFSGPGVIGNYFYPGAPGNYAITVSFIDTNGCPGSFTTFITVIQCCDHTCNVDAGPDQVICQGNPAILSAQGCDSLATWYQLTPEGPVQVGIGINIDIFPQQSACYMVICCGMAPCCCDTDTVCITVYPIPTVIWPYQFGTVCLNSGPVFLDPANIFVLTNNGPVSLPNAGGTWSFSGPNVSFGNFNPVATGSFVITVTYIDANGCIGTATNSITVINCGGCDPATCNCNAVPPPPLPTITINSVTPDSCNQTGCIHATFTGCCLLYSYTYFDPCNPAISFSVAQTNDSAIFCNLKAGNYILYVQDGCGNIAQANVTVPSYFGPLAAFVQYYSCGDSICVVAEGGCPPYAYSWSNGSTGTCVTGFAQCSTLILTITDSNGCSITKVISTPHTSFYNIVQPTCCQPNGSICANVCQEDPAGGGGGYTYLWSNGATTPCISGLAAGQYCLYTYTPQGDVMICCYTLTNAPSLPPSVHFVYNNCGQSVTAVIDQGNCNGATYHWENGSTSLIREELQGCDSVTFTVVSCDGTVYNFGFRIPHVYATITPVDCQTGYGAICAGVECFRCPPYTYSWTPANPVQQNNQPCFPALPGYYNVCITNSCGDVICCQFFLPAPIGPTITFATHNPKCYLYATGFIHPTVSGGTPGYTYQWSNGSTSQNQNNIFAGTYTLTVTDAVGCTSSATTTLIGGTLCGKIIHIHAILEGYYTGGGHMQPVLLNQGVVGVTGNETDTIHVELRDSLDPTLVVDTAVGLLMTDGNAELNFENAADSTSYWIVIKHRNSIQTWSATPVDLTSTAFYDFSASASSTFGDNVKPVEPNVWAIYTGDVNQDEFIDIFDFPDYDLDNQNFVSFTYSSTDFNGDGFVDIFDFPIYDSNNQNFIFSIHP